MNAFGQKQSGCLIAVASILLLLLLGTASGMFPSYAASSTTEQFYFHVSPNGSYNVGTINTGGVIFNSTTLGLSSSGNTKSGTTSYNQNWYLSKLLVGGITVSGAPTMALDIYSSAASQWNYTMQIIEATSSGSTVAVLSSATCSGATGCLSLTTSQALYSSFSFGSIPTTSIPSGDELQVSISISESSGSNNVNVVAENNNPSLTSYWTIPLSVSPVTINSLTLSPTQIVSPGTSTATLSVSDAFGLYDIASSTLSATISGVSATSINTQAMTPSSSNSPSAYTGTWTFTVNPSATSYSSFTGLWSIQSHVTDQSSNSYSSSVQQLNYQISGGSGSTISTTTGIATPPPSPNLIVLAVISILVAGLGVWAIVRKR